MSRAPPGLYCHVTLVGKRLNQQAAGGPKRRVTEFNPPSLSPNTAKFMMSDTSAGESERTIRMRPRAIGHPGKMRIISPAFIGFSRTQFSVRSTTTCSNNYCSLLAIRTAVVAGASEAGMLDASPQCRNVAEAGVGG